MKSTVSSSRAVQICAVSTRQADYWTRLGVINPSIQAGGSGSRRGFSKRDCEALYAVGAAMRSGLTLDWAKEHLAPAVMVYGLTKPVTSGLLTFEADLLQEEFEVAWKKFAR